MKNFPFKTLFVQPPTLGADDLFAGRGINLTSDPSRADAIVFCGGADIDPAFYGQKPIDGTYTVPRRDKIEKALWEKFHGKKPMLGICRGAQFLNAMAGGDMWQDVNGHGGAPHVIYHLRDGEWTGETSRVNTVHHQMMIPAASGIVLAVAFESTIRRKDGQILELEEPRDLELGSEDPDTEIIFYPKEQYYCFQAHPEFGHRETTELFFKQVGELF